LRAAITQVTEREALIESTFVELDAGDPYRERFGEIELTSPRKKDHQDATFCQGHQSLKY
jgi:hypothetical protein